MSDFQQGKHIELIVVDCFACPSTGTTFVLVLTKTNQKVVLWAVTKRMLIPGDIIVVKNGEIQIDRDKDFFKLILMSNLKISVWKGIKKSMFCPGCKRDRPEICNYSKKCQFDSCPYSIQKYESEYIR